MPVVCTAGVNSPDATALFEPEPLLRHFSECLLHDVVTGTPFTARFDKQIAGSLLYLAASTPIVRRLPSRFRSQTPLAEYQQWLAWRAGLTEAHTDAGFTLCFRLEEASPTDADDWQLHFLVAARRRSVAQAQPGRLLAAQPRRPAPKPPGRSARTSRSSCCWRSAPPRGSTPRSGMASPPTSPTGCQLTLDEAFAFLKESAWVLEDAGYTVIVPAWWTPAGPAAGQDPAQDQRPADARAPPRSAPATSASTR